MDGHREIIRSIPRPYRRQVNIRGQINLVSIVATLFTNGGRVGMVVIMHCNHDEPKKRRNTIETSKSSLKFVLSRGYAIGYFSQLKSSEDSPFKLALEHEDDYGEDQMQHVTSVPNVDNIQGFDFDNIQDHIIRIK